MVLPWNCSTRKFWWLHRVILKDVSVSVCTISGMHVCRTKPNGKVFLLWIGAWGRPLGRHEWRQWTGSQAIRNFCIWNISISDQTHMLDRAESRVRCWHECDPPYASATLKFVQSGRKNAGVWRGLQSVNVVLLVSLYQQLRFSAHSQRVKITDIRFSLWPSYSLTNKIVFVLLRVWDQLFVYWCLLLMDDSLILLGVLRQVLQSRRSGSPRFGFLSTSSSKQTRQMVFVPSDDIFRWRLQVLIAGDQGKLLAAFCFEVVYIQV